MQPLIGAARHTPRLPAPAATALRNTFAELGPGPARQHLADIVRLAQPLFADSPRALGALLGNLLAAACATALQTDRLDSILSVLSLRDLPDSAGHIARCTTARNTGLDLMRRAISALGALAATHITEDPHQLAELTRQLESEAHAQAEAAHAVGSLLATR
jgi:hypothetical protein